LLDFNDDGLLDIAVTVTGGRFGQGGLRLYENRGDGSFHQSTALGTLSSPGPITAVDVNGDGRVDLAVANQLSNAVSIYLGRPQGGFDAPVHFAGGDYAATMVAIKMRPAALPSLVLGNLGYPGDAMVPGSSRDAEAFTVLVNDTYRRPRGVTGR
jgi:FG-GAP-like repeat